LLRGTTQKAGLPASHVGQVVDRTDPVAGQIGVADQTVLDHRVVMKIHGAGTGIRRSFPEVELAESNPLFSPENACHQREGAGVTGVGIELRVIEQGL
jgi:hypothetical protein